jgi:hypothetical protein
LDGWLPRLGAHETKMLKLVSLVIEEREPTRSFVLELSGARITELELPDVAELVRRLR